MDTRGWERGIPYFDPYDILTEDDIRSFGVDTMVSVLKDTGFEVINFQAVKNIWPNIVAKKDNFLWFIAVATGVAPEYGALEEDEKENLIAHAAKFNAIAAIAYVSIGSTDPERFDASLLLRQDNYQFNFKPMEILNK